MISWNPGVTLVYLHNHIPHSDDLFCGQTGRQTLKYGGVKVLEGGATRR